MTRRRVLLLSGPNLDLLGTREPDVYGPDTLADHVRRAEKAAADHGLELEHHQSNHEGQLVDLIQAARTEADAIIINPAGLSFTSISIIDALKVFDGPIIELHVSNIHARDELHRHSKTSASATAVICGLGPYGYVAAMLAAVQRLGRVPEALPAVLRRAPGAGP